MRNVVLIITAVCCLCVVGLPAQAGGLRGEGITYVGTPTYLGTETYNGFNDIPVYQVDELYDHGQAVTRMTDFQNVCDACGNEFLKPCIIYCVPNRPRMAQGPCCPPPTQCAPCSTCEQPYRSYCPPPRPQCDPCRTTCYRENRPYCPERCVTTGIDAFEEIGCALGETVGGIVGGVAEGIGGLVGGIACGVADAFTYDCDPCPRITCCRW